MKRELSIRIQGSAKGITEAFGHSSHRVTTLTTRPVSRSRRATLVGAMVGGTAGLVASPVLRAALHALLG